MKEFDEIIKNISKI